MKKIKDLFLLILLITVIVSCKDDTTDITTLNKDKITGYAQKGPFNNGSAVLISELNSDFVNMTL